MLRVVKMTVKTSKKLPCVHIWINSQNSQLTDFDLYSYLPLKFSYSRRVNGWYCMCLYTIYIVYAFKAYGYQLRIGNCALTNEIIILLIIIIIIIIKICSAHISTLLGAQGAETEKTGIQTIYSDSKNKNYVPRYMYNALMLKSF